MEMPNNMPHDMPQMIDEAVKKMLSSVYPLNELRQIAREWERKYKAEMFYKMMGELHHRVENDPRRQKFAQYILEAYGKGPGAKYFHSHVTQQAKKPEKPVMTTTTRKADSKTDIDQRVNLDTIVDYCINETANYQEVKPVYDMLNELLENVNHPKWEEAKAKLKKRMKEMEKKTVVASPGTTIVMEQNVDHMVENVEPGATGININKTQST